MVEEWRDIKDFTGYKISDLGRVKSFRRYPEGRLLTLTDNKDGYKEVGICNKSGQKTKSVHRLVYETFNGPIPENLVVDHKDNIPYNNSSDNLQIITIRENLTKDKNGKNRFTGVSISGRKWRAKIKIKSKNINLGSFDREEDARDAYQNKLKEINR